MGSLVQVCPWCLWRKNRDYGLGSASGPVYQAGTLSGNPLAMAAGKAAFDQLAAPGFYEALEEKEHFFEGLVRPILEKHGQPAHFERQGSLFYMWFERRECSP